MNRLKLETLLDKAELAKRAATDELMRLYPVGTEIEFMLKSGQRHPSTGRVACASSAPGHLRVEHYQAKQYSRYAYRDVFYKNVVGKCA